VLPIRIGDRRVKRLGGKEVPLVKVMWNQKTRDATTRLEHNMKEEYPELFLNY
jgi:hypothetical protein